MKLAQISDLHLDEDFPKENGVDAEANLFKILEDISSRNITEVIFTGDIGSKASNQWFFDQMGQSGLDYRVILGNHDAYEHTKTFYQPDDSKGRDGLYYSYENESLKWIFLDSSTDKISAEQLTWFQGQINTDKRILLFVHHPILESGTIAQKEYPLDGSKAIFDLLQSIDQQVNIFCGHIHLTDKQSLGNITQWACPAMCFQTKRDSKTTELDNIDFGYQILTIDENQVSVEVVMFQPN